MIEGSVQDFLAGFVIEPVDRITNRVSTPFPDREGRPIGILIRQRGSQFYLFNEKDRIFSRERIGRFVPHEVKEELRQVLRRFDVYHIDGEITTGATAENPGVRFRNLLQALILLDVMF